MLTDLTENTGNTAVRVTAMETETMLVFQAVGTSEWERL